MKSVATLGVCLAVLVGACSSGSPSDGVPPSTSSTSEAGEVSAFQAGILADGKVERSEYERAIFGYRDCLDRGGVGTDEIVESLGLLFVPLLSPTEADLDIVATCDQEFKSLVESQYVANNTPSVEQMDREYAVWLDCLHSKGYDIPQGADPSTVDQVLEDVPLDELLTC